MGLEKCVVYIGDFDLRNENVQAHLVKNNGKILNRLGYTVAYIGVNRDAQSFEELADLDPVAVGENRYLELPYTLSIPGLRRYRSVSKAIIAYLNELAASYTIEFVISYQAPTFATVLSTVVKWCRAHRAAYIVNCADLPIFDSQPFLRRMVMTWNWQYMHRVNQQYADGVIAVSRYIQKFYQKDGRASVIVPPLFDEAAVEAQTTAGETPTFLYAGTPFVLLDQPVDPAGMKDRLDKVIDLFAALSAKGVRYTFTVVGITKEAYVTCVPRHKETVNDEHIVFLGRLPHHQTLARLTASDFMINYRDKNLMTEAGLSTKVVESVSVGTPVVMNDIGDTFEYLREGVSGFKLSGDAERDMAQLTTLCGMSAEDRAALKSACYADKTFSISRYEDVLEQFLAAVKQA